MILQTIVLIVFLTIATLCESVGPMLTLVSVLTYLFMCGLIGYTYNFIINNPTTFLTCFVGYFLIGILWSFYRYYLFMKDEVKTYNYLKKEDLKQQTSISRSDNIQMISNWIINWPISMIVYIFYDLLGDLCNMIINYFKSIYDKIADYVIGGVKDEV